MFRLIFLLFTTFLFIKKAMANPACAVCTVAIGASLEIARSLGVPDAIVGLWAGALLSLLGYWTMLFFDKKNCHFLGRDILLMFLSVGMIGFIYTSEVVYNPKIIWKIFYMDEILFSTILGMFLFIYTEKFYDFMKAKNNGHAHFPFEKVVLPVIILTIVSFYLSCFPL